MEQTSRGKGNLKKGRHTQRRKNTQRRQKPEADNTSLDFESEDENQR